jgi:hypothetical protein
MMVHFGPFRIAIKAVLCGLHAQTGILSSLYLESSGSSRVVVPRGKTNLFLLQAYRRSIEHHITYVHKSVSLSYCANTSVDIPICMCFYTLSLHKYRQQQRNFARVYSAICRSVLRFVSLLVFWLITLRYWRLHQHCILISIGNCWLMSLFKCLLWPLSHCSTSYNMAYDGHIGF